MNENNSNENLTNENANNEQVKNEVENKVEYVPKKKKNRKGDKDIYVQYRKPSIFSTILLVLIGILVGVVAMLLLYVVKINKDVEPYKEELPVVEQPQEEVQKPEDDIPVVEEKELDLSLDGEFVKELQSKIVHDLWSYEVAYCSRLHTINDVTASQKMIFVLRKMQLAKEYQEISSDGIIDRLNQQRIYTTMGDKIPTVDKYDMEQLKAKYKAVYGAESEIIKQDIETNLGYVFEYDAQDDCYYGHYYAGGGGFPFVSLTSAYSCEANADKTEIYLYEYYISACGMDGKIYSDSTRYNEIDQATVTLNDSERLYNNVTEDKLIDNYKENKAGKYKHTFKKDSEGNYYWYSCEPVQ